MKNKKMIIICSCLILVFTIVILGVSFSNVVELENDTRVEPNSDLIYYLNVNYDGVDRFGVESSDDVIADVNSGVIYVQDTIPDGLIFNGFVKTNDGSIGAINEKTNQACLGKVVDDTDGIETLESYHGLHYDEETRTVSFKVTNLQAGCVLTVGIKTITPEIDDPATEIVEHRRDFYNFASSKEDDFYYKSNTVHTWMGIDNITLYKVKYQYLGDVPDNVPELPDIQSYVEGSSVVLLSEPLVSGYSFSGWSSSDVKVTNSSFEMPAKDIVFYGSFIKNKKYKVSYEILGDVPELYEVPITKEYSANDNVYIDKLKSGDAVDGYVFSGWKDKTTGKLIDSNFTMENKDVQLVGSFELKKYNVTYAFYDTILPDNSDLYLPSSQSFAAGEVVTLPVVNDVGSYKFNGWYYSDNFKMPEEDIVIYGEWKLIADVFVPRINIKIKEEDNFLHIPGDVVNFEVNVFNDEDYPIRDVYVSNNLNGVEVNIDETNGKVINDSMILLYGIPANGSVSYNSSYVVKGDDTGTIENEVQIISVLSEDNKSLDVSKDYKDSDFLTIKSSVYICNEIITKNDNSVFEYEIKGVDFSKTISLESGKCETIYVDPGEYTILQSEKEKYKISRIDGAISNNGDKVVVKESENKYVKYYNELIVESPNTSSGFIIVFVIILLVIILGCIYLVLIKLGYLR